MWNAVMHMKSSSYNSLASDVDGEVMGWIESWPNPFSSTVVVRLDMLGETCEVHMPWADRADGFSHFLTRCTRVMRISATICGRNVRSYALWVHGGELSRQMRECAGVYGEIHLLSMLKHFALHGQLSREFMVYRIATPPTPISEATHGVAIDGWNPHFPLFPSQVRSVAWMCSIETAIASATNLLHYEACIPVTTGQYCYDIVLDALRQKSAVLKTRFRGACLCDGVGTGKTACALALAALPDTVPMPMPADVIVSNATCILVPVNLPVQWTQEIEKFVPSLRTVVLTSMRDIRQYTLQDLVAAQIVITTPNLLKNRALVDELSETVRRTLGEDELERRDDGWQRAVHACSRRMRTLGGDDLSGVPPFVELVMFRRLVVDELHEYVLPNTAGRERMRAMRSLQARVTWGLTATPNTAHEALQMLYPLLLEPKICDADTHHHPCLMSAVRDGLHRCHSRECNETSHALCLVRLSACERAMLADEPLVSKSRAVQMCSCPEVSMSDAEALAQLLDERALVVSQAYEDVVQRENALVRAATRGGGGGDVMKRLCSNLSGAEASWDAVAREHAFSSRRLHNVGRCVESCPVCLEMGCHSMIACGHVLCTRCASKLLQTSSASPACPICRQPFERAYTVGIERKGGSKVAACAQLLERLVHSGERVIACSQWKTLAVSVLDEMGGGTRGGILEGPTARRSSVVRKFQEGSINVLFLLFDRSCAGLNLTEATSVVFMHAITGSASDATAMEQQAVGRAARHGQQSRVKVYHVIAEDTHEADLWNQRHTVDGRRDYYSVEIIDC